MGCGVIRRRLPIDVTLCAAALAALWLAVQITPSLSAEQLARTGTLRASFVASYPVHASADPATGQLRGPASEMTREIAGRLGVPFRIRALASFASVIDSVKSDEADIAFVAFDPARAADVAFSHPYLLTHGTYLVRERSMLQSVADVDRTGVRVGVTARSALDLGLTRKLKNAQLIRMTGSNIAMGLKMLTVGEIDAYAADRQRLMETAVKTSGVRVLPDNFDAMEISVVVAKNRAAQIDFIDRVIDGARTSGLIQGAILRAGLKGVDVATR